MIRLMIIPKSENYEFFVVRSTTGRIMRII